MEDLESIAKAPNDGTIPFLASCAIGLAGGVVGGIITGNSPVAGYVVMGATPFANALLLSYFTHSKNEEERKQERVANAVIGFGLGLFCMAIGYKAVDSAGFIFSNGL